MVVDVSKPNTYPAELEQMIVNYFTELSQETYEKLEQKK